MTVLPSSSAASAVVSNRSAPGAKLNFIQMFQRRFLTGLEFVPIHLGAHSGVEVLHKILAMVLANYGVRARDLLIFNNHIVARSLPVLRPIFVSGWRNRNSG